LNYMQPRVDDEMLYMKSLASLSHNKTPEFGIVLTQFKPKGREQWLD